MKTYKSTILSSICCLSLLITAAAQPSAPPGANAPPATNSAPSITEQSAPPQDAAAGPGAAVVPARPAAPEEAIPAEAPKTSANGSKELRLNFRNAPLESVLNYLSDAAGYIIDQRTEVRGKVTVWSNQPVSKDEAFNLLNAALDQNGYTAVRNGRTLTIYTKDEAKKRDLPVKAGSKPEDIPKNDQMVTQIIPVRFINAVQLARDLQPLKPDNATWSSNEGGNSLIITDTQVNIRRIAEIIRALDTSISSVSSVRVFPLRFADAKALASVIKDLFAPQDTGRTGSGANAAASRFFNQFRGGGPGGGAFGGRGGGSQASAADSAGGGRAPTPRVIAVAEERSNSVVVSAPDDQMPVIEDLVKQVDTNVEDITELRVFRLRYADAQETADLLTQLFSDSNMSSGNNQGFRGAIQFGGRFGARGGTRGMASITSADQSSRLQKQTKVVAVPDLRTGSVVVSAARDLMQQIGKMIEELDSDASKKQQVFVFDVQNTDPQQVQDILQSLFPAPLYGNSLNSRMNSRQQNAPGSQLNSRATQLQNQGYNRNMGGMGGMGGLGGTGRTFGQ